MYILVCKFSNCGKYLTKLVGDIAYGELYNWVRVIHPNSPTTPVRANVARLAAITTAQNVTRFASMAKCTFAKLRTFSKSGSVRDIGRSFPLLVDSAKGRVPRHYTSLALHANGREGNCNSNGTLGRVKKKGRSEDRPRLKCDTEEMG